jgi:hypothetical protein
MDERLAVGLERPEACAVGFAPALEGKAVGSPQ